MAGGGGVTLLEFWSCAFFARGVAKQCPHTLKYGPYCGLAFRHFCGQPKTPKPYRRDPQTQEDTSSAPASAFESWCFLHGGLGCKVLDLYINRVIYIYTHVTLNPLCILHIQEIHTHKSICVIYIYIYIHMCVYSCPLYSCSGRKAQTVEPCQAAKLALKTFTPPKCAARMPESVI